MVELKDPSIKLFGKTILPIPASSLADRNSDEEEPDKESPSAKSSKNEEKSETSVSEEKTLKKPDKIVPCPRCNSMDTKFCYYNNYNVNQPRHFCKNCQRYWTAGGTMRNVPVGAGRRKNKNSQASHYCHLVMSDALHRAQANPGTGTVLSFASDPSTVRGNGFPGIERRVVTTNVGFDNRDNLSSCSSIITASTSSEKGGEAVAVEYPRPPWPYSWGPPALCGHSGYPVSFYPAPPYWGSVGSWNVPCFSQASSTTNQSSSGSVPNQSVLGKHSRDGEILNSASSQKGSPVNEHSHGSDRYVLVPKTLRIDDPTEAAKSSIWATLGIKNEKLGSSNGGGLYKAFQSKGGEKNHAIEASPMLQANPAAFSRSVRFLEST